MNVIHTVDRVVEKIRKRIATRRRIEFIRNHATELRELPVGAGRYKVALHFPDEMVNAYQLRQWYEPLVALAEFVPVVILVRSPETALSLREECPLPIHYAPAVDDMERLMHSQDLRVVFYVNQNIRNFQALRFNGPNHVFICHGESEKAYMWSNQLKAYDYVFSAGEAAKDRLAKHLRNFDPSERCRLIGRPQIDVNYTPPVTVNSPSPDVELRHDMRSKPGCGNCSSSVVPTTSSCTSRCATPRRAPVRARQPFCESRSRDDANLAGVRTRTRQRRVLTRILAVSRPFGVRRSGLPHGIARRNMLNLMFFS
ncbi:hypothetical protein [Glutamicibacter nicotianae]|uniref:hypothetical protein n=1 Tax=Glutamicibacter nicotianae TaxID=37929 RepID=UPI003CD0AF5E